MRTLGHYSNNNSQDEGHSGSEYDSVFPKRRITLPKKMFGLGLVGPSPTRFQGLHL